MKRILVTQRIDWVESHKEFRDSLDQRLISLVVASGFMPIPVPNFNQVNDKESNNLIRFVQEMHPDGIILSGGNDLGEFPDRDSTELQLIDFAERFSIPLLGICRGMQIMGVANGSKLIKVDGHSGTSHAITGKTWRTVDSFHNYALDACPKDYHVTAFSEDGSIEAIAHKTRRMEGWMWHPERISEVTESVTKEIQRVFSDSL